MNGFSPYQVLARRYRPQQFSEVVGQEAVVTTLKNALRLKQIAHAYLFSGSRGIGKTTLARIFSKALNCSNLTESYEPCNQCSSCREITEGCSLDVLEIDGASHRGIDDIRQINETVGYAPSQGRYKIYLIDEVHMLTKEAFNALLKTLEEPPAQAKFFFATTEPQKVPATILSRCQRFDLSRLKSSQLIAKLEEIRADLNRPVDPEALHLIARFSDGSLRDAESLFDQILCFAPQEITKEHVEQALGLLPQDLFFSLDAAFADYNLSFALELVEELYTKGKDFFHFFEQLVEHYRRIVLCKVSASQGEKNLSPELFAAYGRSLSIYTLPQALYALEYLLRVEGDLQKSPYPRVSLETHLLHLIRSRHRIPAEVLLRHLLELEKGEAKSAPLLGSTPEEPIIQQTQQEPAKTALPKPPSSTPLVQAPFDPMPAPPREAAKTEKPIIQQTQQDSKATQQEPAKKTLPKPPSSASLVQAPFDPMPAPPRETAKIEKPIIQQTQHEPAKAAPPKHPSHYDTLIRFAAVELEGTVNLSH